MLGILALRMPYVGFLLLPIILLIGYVFTLLMNSMGAFVHSLRLQYVEFFPKFFEGGKKVFRPFKMETKYFKIGGE
jgi:V/A-type H+-transporting ATPase subunit I